MSTRQLALDFFECLHKELSREIRVALQSGILTQHSKKQKAAHVLNAILQESILRYLGLRSFYSSRARYSKFELEVKTGTSGPLDLVLTDKEFQYAFEFKRWQTPREENSILRKDLENLVPLPKVIMKNRFL